MGEHHHNQSSNRQPWASPAMFGVILVGVVFFALFCYVAYYGLKTTSYNPLQMMQ